MDNRKLSGTKLEILSCAKQFNHCDVRTLEDFKL